MRLHPTGSGAKVVGFRGVAWRSRLIFEMTDLRADGFKADALSGAKSMNEPSHIVGVGASAGGLEALQKFFAAMRDDSGLAFVVIQHLSPHFKSMMDELLARHTTLPVVVVNEAVRVEPNIVYLLPPRREMVLDGLELSVREKSEELQLSPISTFFSSLAQQHGERAVGVVLSGTGSDGSAGVVDIREAGGLVFVQSEASAKFDGMPHSAVATGVAHGVYPAERIPWAILQTIEHGQLQEPLPDDEGQRLPAIESIVEQLNKAYDLDFKLYKQGTIHRRIERRMALSQISSAQAYADHVLEHKDELESLYKDMLIGVTQFFRNPQAFEVLENTVIPKIMADPDTRSEIRVWVPGCASGEEAYSVAMLLLEAIEGSVPPRKLRVFATDRHRGSLQKAADGIYSAAEIEAVPLRLREKYFASEEGENFRVIPMLRRCLIFSTHNLIKDPPFTQLDLVSCRNLLIYFQPIAQNRALSSFYCGLRMNGRLFLGPSESCGNLTREFQPTHARWKFYRKATNHPIPLSLGGSSGAAAPLLFHQNRSRKEAARHSRIYETLVNKFVPTGVLVNAEREVLHLFGDANEFLRPRPGPVSSDVVELAHGNLRIALASALQSAMRGRQSLALRGVRLDQEEGQAETEHYRQLDVEVEVIEDRLAAEHFYLVTLSNIEQRRMADLPARGSSASASDSRESQFHSGNASKSRIFELEHELSQTRESLQTVVEELETSNEELQSSNEELLSSNEELQSTNEELHSVNEELYTVNAEYEQKIGELNEATSDLRNFMEAVGVGSVFTDRDFKIRLFTPAATEVLNLIPLDVGRDLRHITSRVRGDDLLEDLASVFEEGRTRESEIELPDGRSMLRTVRSYVDYQGEPAGLILTFVEVTRLKRTEARRRLVETRLRRELSSARHGFWEHDLPSGERLWDEGSLDLLGLESVGLPRQNVDGQTLFVTKSDLWLEVVPQEQRDQAQAMLERARNSSGPAQLDLAILRKKDGRSRRIRLTWDRIEEQEKRIFGTVVDITER